MILRILLCAVLQFCIIGYVFGVVPQITRLNVQCDRTGMKVNVEFDNPFNGIIFSKGHYSDPNCRWVKSSSSRRQFNFYVGTSKCGTIGTDMSVGSTSQGFKNVIIIQNDPDYQEVWDTARKLSCDWVTKLEKYVTFAPFGVDMLGVKELRFPGDTVDCWMDIQRGHGPFAPSVGGVVPIGEKLTVVIYVRDTDSSFDVHVKDCYAYDSSDYRNPNARAIKLTDERGCPVKEKLVQGFYRTRDVRTSGATIIAYGIINAFKFPERMDVFLACNVEVCKGTCPNNDCQPEVAVAGSGDESSGSTTAAPSTGGGDDEKEEGEEKPDGSSTTEATDTDDGEKSTDETTDSGSGTATEESESSEDTSEKPKTDTEDKEESKDEETKDEESKDEESKDEESKDEEKKDEGEEKKDGEESKDEESKDEEKKDEGEEKKDDEESKDDKEESSNDVDAEKSDDSEKKEDEKSDDAEKSDDSEKKEETKDDEEGADEEQTKEESSSSTSKPDSKADEEEDEEESGRKAAKIKLAKKSSRKAKKADVIIPRKRSAKRPSRKNASASRSAAPSTKPKSGKLKKDKEVKLKKIKSKSKSKSKPKSSNLKTSNSVRSTKAKVKPRSIRIIRAPSSIPAAFSRQLREANMAYDQMYQRQGRHIRSRRSATVSENATFPAMMHSISIISPIEDLDEKELNAWEKMVDLEGKAEEVSLFEAITKLPTFSSEGGYCFTMVSLASASVLLAAIVMILSMSVAMACLHLHVRSSAASGKAVDLY